MLAHFILSLLYFEWCKLIRWLLVPAASHGCQNMTKEPVLVIFWSNLCNQYRGLPRQILPFIWVKNMFFRLVSASLGQIWTFLRRVFRSPVNVALKEGCAIASTTTPHHSSKSTHLLLFPSCAFHYGHVRAISTRKSEAILATDLSFWRWALASCAPLNDRAM